MRSIAFFLALTFVNCSTATSPAASQPCDPGTSILNATLWMQSAAEYRAGALQTYAAARRALDAALANDADSALPPAIILDLDETALDNTPYAARSIVKGKTFLFDDGWEQWVAESAAEAVPGAGEFLAYAKSRGVTPFYITNRGTAEYAATRANLEKLGFPLGTSKETLLVRGARPEWNTFDKSPRRDFVASRYRVLLFLGDDLNDFTAANGKSVAERTAIVDGAAASWGTRWFVVPNPIYGSWENAITGSGGTPCEELRKMVESLRP
jgi:5'-nucleotidase (lipoprotein e(P4) family)